LSVRRRREGGSRGGFGTESSSSSSPIPAALAARHLEVDRLPRLHLHGEPIVDRRGETPRSRRVERGLAKCARAGERLDSYHVAALVDDQEHDDLSLDAETLLSWRIHGFSIARVLARRLIDHSLVD